MNKIKVKEVFLERAEGPVADCIKVTVPSLAEATNTLMRWSWTAPKDLGYDKCDFRVTFEDGEVYEGRYDLKRGLKDEGSLQHHIVSFIEFYAGKHKPPHLTEQKYRDFLRSAAPDPTPYLEFLEKYDLE